jgi:hypothetical protein
MSLDMASEAGAEAVSGVMKIKEKRGQQRLSWECQKDYKDCKWASPLSCWSLKLRQTELEKRRPWRVRHPLSRWRGRREGGGNVRFGQRKPEPDQSVVESTLGRDSEAVLRDGVQAASPEPGGASEGVSEGRRRAR